MIMHTAQDEAKLQQTLHTLTELVEDDAEYTLLIALVKQFYQVKRQRQIEKNFANARNLKELRKMTTCADTKVEGDNVDDRLLTPRRRI